MSYHDMISWHGVMISYHDISSRYHIITSYHDIISSCHIMRSHHDIRSSYHSMLSHRDITGWAIILPKLSKDPKWVAMRDLGPRLANFCAEFRPAFNGMDPRPGPPPLRRACSYTARAKFEDLLLTRRPELSSPAELPFLKEMCFCIFTQKSLTSLEYKEIKPFQNPEAGLPKLAISCYIIRAVCLSICFGKSTFL